MISRPSSLPESRWRLSVSLAGRCSGSGIICSQCSLSDFRCLRSLDQIVILKMHCGSPQDSERSGPHGRDVERRIEIGPRQRHISSPGGFMLPGRQARNNSLFCGGHAWASSARDPFSVEVLVQRDSRTRNLLYCPTVSLPNRRFDGVKAC
jgi:hypothetical protein